MSNHRMFSNRIANSAKFLQMPAECQLLYFHMILRADDDGVVEAYPLMKLLSTPSDVIKVLIGKEFIRQLNDDQVMIINDWLEHNIIRADRKVNSVYSYLIPKEIITIKPKPRSDVKDNSRRTVHGLSTVSLSKDKLSQVKISKDNLRQVNTKDISVGANKSQEQIQELFNLFYKSINPNINFGNKTERSAAEFLITKYGLEKTLSAAQYAISVQGDKYSPTIMTPLALKDKMAALAKHKGSKEQPKGKNIIL